MPKLGHKIEIDILNNVLKRKENLTYKQWAVRLNKSLTAYEFLLSPDLIILGGGISAQFEKYEKYFTIKTKVIPAKLENLAGIIGAAVTAKEKLTWFWK